MCLDEKKVIKKQRKISGKNRKFTSKYMRKSIRKFVTVSEKNVSRLSDASDLKRYRDFYDARVRNVQL